MASREDNPFMLTVYQQENGVCSQDQCGRTPASQATEQSRTLPKIKRLAGEPVSRILCGAVFISRFSPGHAYLAAAIIPLGHGSHRDSSSLPEGSHPRWLAPPQKERVHFHERLLIEPGRLSPPIWPCTTRGFPCPRCCHRSGGLLPHLFTLAKRSEPVEAGFSPSCFTRPASAQLLFEDVSQVSLCDATALHSAGGLFSVALSVAPRVA